MARRYLALTLALAVALAGCGEFGERGAPFTAALGSSSRGVRGRGAEFTRGAGLRGCRTERAIKGACCWPGGVRSCPRGAIRHRRNHPRRLAATAKPTPVKPSCVEGENGCKTCRRKKCVACEDGMGLKGLKCVMVRRQRRALGTATSCFLTSGSGECPLWLPRWAHQQTWPLLATPLWQYPGFRGFNTIELLFPPDLPACLLAPVRTAVQRWRGLPVVQRRQA